MAVIHNGIIENFAELTKELAERGVVMTSETDTEVVAHLLESTLADTGDLADAMRAACQRLSGAFTLVAVSADEPGRLVAARRNSPLVVGIGEGENFLASDVSAFIEFTRDAIELGQDQVVDLRADEVIVTDFAGKPVEVTPFTVTWDAAAAEKGGYDLFMLKEIAEQPKAVADTLLGRIDPTGCCASTRSACPWPSCARSTRSSSSPAARPTTRGWWPSTPSSTGAGSRSRSSWPASSATATRS